MFNEELSDLARVILPVLAVPIVTTAWIICIVSNKIAEYLYGGGDEIIRSQRNIGCLSNSGT